jgi:hypothetical protein
MQCVYIVLVQYCKLGFYQAYKSKIDIFGLGYTYMEICCKMHYWNQIVTYL